MFTDQRVGDRGAHQIQPPGNPHAPQPDGLVAAGHWLTGTQQQCSDGLGANNPLGVRMNPRATYLAIRGIGPQVKPLATGKCIPQRPLCHAQIIRCHEDNGEPMHCQQQERTAGREQICR